MLASAWLLTRPLASRMQIGVLVVGAGPTGLGAATRLNQLGHSDWLLVDEVGGVPGGVDAPPAARHSV